MGTVFSLLPSQLAREPEAAFAAAGDRQLAAGFVLYGPHTVLARTLGQGAQGFTLDPRDRIFRLTPPAPRIPEGRRGSSVKRPHARPRPRAHPALLAQIGP